MNKKTKKATSDLMEALEYAVFAGFRKRYSGLDRVVARMNGKELPEYTDLRDYKIESLEDTLRKVTFNPNWFKDGNTN